MSQTKVPETSGPEVVPEELGFLDRLIGDIRQRPGFWLVILVILGALIAGALIARKVIAESRDSALTERGEAFQAAIELEDPAERVSALRDLRSMMAGTEIEARYLLTLARQAQAAAEESRDNAEKLAFYREAVQVADELKSSFPKNPLVVMPAEPKLTPGAPDSPSLVEGIRTYAQDQIAWLEKHPYVIKEVPDPNLLATIELEEPAEGDGEPVKHTLRLQFFSDHAPIAVDSFVNLARSGYFDGTRVFGLEKHYRDDSLIAVRLGSAMSKVAPDDITAWGGKEDEVGFTLPTEGSPLEHDRGKVVLQQQNEAHGVSPVQFAILLDDMYWDRRPVFARVHPDDMAILDKLGAMERGETGIPPQTQYHFHPAKPWKVLGLTVTGQPENPPARPLRAEVKLPEPPAKEEAEKPEDDSEVPDNSEQDEPK